MKTSKHPKVKQMANVSTLSEKKTARSISQFCQDTQDYLQVFQKLFSKLEANKVRKISQQIKNKNIAFKDYLHDTRIQTIKFEDVLKFQDLFQRNQNEYSRKNINSQFQLIKHGFLQLKRKMQEYAVIDFQTQIRYCSSTIQREIDKLNRHGGQYQGLYLLGNSYSIAEQIDQQQKQNGVFGLLNKKEVQKSSILEHAQSKFRNVLTDK